MTFDATSREFCTVRRVRTNTPLQALTLLNDPASFEAAQGLAGRMRQHTTDLGTRGARIELPHARDAGRARERFGDQARPLALRRERRRARPPGRGRDVLLKLESGTK